MKRSIVLAQYYDQYERGVTNDDEWLKRKRNLGGDSTKARVPYQEAILEEARFAEHQKEADPKGVMLE